MKCFYHPNEDAVAQCVKCMNSNMSNAIRESYSDIMGEIIENDDNDLWLCGTENSINNTHFRDMMAPRYISSYNDKSDEHFNALILDNVAYLMYHNGLTKDQIGKLWYKSIKKYKNITNPNFNSVRSAVLKSANDINMLDSEINIIKQSFNQVGIFDNKICGTVKSNSGNQLITNAKVTLYWLDKSKCNSLDNLCCDFEDSLCASPINNCDPRHCFNKCCNTIKSEVITTDSNGYYQFEHLGAGYFWIEISADGYENYNKVINNDFSNSNFEVFSITEDTEKDFTLKAFEKIRIELTWGTNPSDLDSYLYQINGGKILLTSYPSKYYYNNGKLIANLDADDTSGNGDETTTVYQKLDGKLRFYVRDFTNKNNNSNTQLSSSNAVVKVYFGNSSSPRYTYYVPKGTGIVWTVFEYDFTTGECTELNQISNNFS